MCSAPKPPPVSALPLPPAAVAPLAPAVLDMSQSDPTKITSSASRGRSSLRIDRTVSTLGGQGGGLNIPR